MTDDRQATSLTIGFVEPHLRLYGGIRRIMELSNRLVSRGHKVTIYHSDGEPCQWMEGRAQTRPARDVLADRLDVVVYNDPSKRDYALVRDCQATLKVHFPLELYDTSLLQGFHPRLYVMRWHSSYRRACYLRRSLHARHIDLLLVNGSWMQSWLKSHLDLDSTLLLGGVNRDVFHPVDRPRPADPVRVLHSGDPRTRKGTDTVVAALARVRAAEPSVIADSFYGKDIPQDEMAATYAAADIFVDGQHSAGWNNPVAEAMACGTAVVCTDIGGVRDVAFHDQTALLVPPGDADAMAAAILHLVRHPEDRDRLRTEALRHIAQFDWDDSARRLEELLLAHLQRKGAALPPFRQMS